jgi:hypothetical protein
MGPSCAFTGLHLAAPARLPTQRARCRVFACAGEGRSGPDPVRLTRRAALSLTALLAVSSMHAGRAEAEDEPPAKLLALPPLPYAYDSLEPAIDKETMVLHHDKHFAKFVLQSFHSATYFLHPPPLTCIMRARSTGHPSLASTSDGTHSSPILYSLLVQIHRGSKHGSVENSGRRARGQWESGQPCRIAGQSEHREG